MKRSFLLLAFSVLFLGSSANAASPVIDDINGSLTPGFFIFDTAVPNIGWVYEPSFDYSLDGVFSTFRAIPNPPVATRTVTLSVYDAPPSSGGVVLRSGAFSAGAAGGNLGISFASLDVHAGDDYFIALENVDGLGLNIVDFDFANGPDNIFMNADDPAVYTSGWYTGAGFTTFHSAASSPGFAAPILRFTGVPEPTTALLGSLAVGFTASIRGRRLRSKC